MRSTPILSLTTLANHSRPAACDRVAAMGHDCQKTMGSTTPTDWLKVATRHGAIGRYWTRNGVIVRKDCYELEELGSLVVGGWMPSPGCRENSLDCNYGVEGIGVAINAAERVYTTQNLCYLVPRPTADPAGT